MSCNAFKKELPMLLDPPDRRASKGRNSMMGSRSPMDKDISDGDKVSLDKLQKEIRQGNDRLQQEMQELRGAQERNFRDWEQQLVFFGTLRKELLEAVAQAVHHQVQNPEIIVQKEERERDRKIPAVPESDFVPALQVKCATSPRKEDDADHASPRHQSWQETGSRISKCNGALARSFTNANAIGVGDAQDPEEEEISGRAKGEFKGRPNLHAFLQAKHWASGAAEYPDRDYTPAEPPPHGCCGRTFPKVERAIMSHTFDLVIGVVIMINSITMALQLEYEGMYTADAIGIERDEGAWPHAKEAFNVLEHVFAIIFFVELMLRLSVMGCQYFKQPLNLMDVAIVSVSLLELYISVILGFTVPNMTMLRLLRVCKIVRVLRILRVLKFFRKLRNLINAVVCSMPSLGWSVCLLGIIQLAGSILMTLSLQSFLQDESEDEEQRKQIYTFFGSFSRSVITLFEMTLAIGTWGRVGRVVIFGVSRWYALFFLGYLTLVSFAVIRVISAIFLKETLAASSKDADILMAQENRDPAYVQKIRAVFNDMDLHSTGTLSLEDIEACVQDKDICRRLIELNIDIHEVKGLFTLMDDGDDEVQFAEFLTGILRLKNSGKGVDLATLLYENKKILKRVLVVDARVDELSERFGIKSQVQV